MQPSAVFPRFECVSMVWPFTSPLPALYPEPTSPPTSLGPGGDPARLDTPTWAVAAGDSETSADQCPVRPRSGATSADPFSSPPPASLSPFSCLASSPGHVCLVRLGPPTGHPAAPQGFHGGGQRTRLKAREQNSSSGTGGLLQAQTWMESTSSLALQSHHFGRDKSGCGQRLHTCGI